MNALFAETAITHGREANGALEQCMRQEVRTFVSTMNLRGLILERRRDQRLPFPHLILLTPVANDGLIRLGPSQVVVGKHLSERGLGFFHQDPLPFRRAIVALEANDGHTLNLLMDLSWCRFTKRGWYESGGRFLQVILDDQLHQLLDSPLES